MQVFRDVKAIFIQL